MGSALSTNVDKKQAEDNAAAANKAQEDLDFSGQPPLKVHEGPISFDAGDGQGFRKQYGGRTPERQREYLEAQESDAYAAALRAAKLPPGTADYPRMTTPADAQNVLKKIHSDEIKLWDGYQGKIVPAVSKGFPGTSCLHIASMPGSDCQVYNDVVLACLEDRLSFGIVWECNWQDLWFHVWKRLQLQALADGKHFLVLTKDDGSIGFNQTIEVSFLQRRGITFQAVTAKHLLAQLRPLIQAAMYHQDHEVAALMQCSRVAAQLQQSNHEGKVPLHTFASSGKLGLAKAALAAHADIEARTFAGITPLLVAAHNGQEGALQLLLAARAQVDGAQNDGATPLFIAAQKGQEGALQLLLAARAQVDRAQNDGATPLYIAAQNGQEGALQLLLAARAQVDRARNDGATPLLIAAGLGQEGTTRLLLAARGDVDHTTPFGTPLQVARSGGHSAVERLLLSARP